MAAKLNALLRLMKQRVLACLKRREAGPHGEFFPAGSLLEAELAGTTRMLQEAGAEARRSRGAGADALAKLDSLRSALSGPPPLRSVEEPVGSRL